MSIQLIEGERVVRTARQHWIVFVPAGAVCALVIAAAAVVLWVSPASVGGRSLHDAKALVMLGIALAVAAVLSVRWLRWRFNAYVLTDHRVVVSTGVLSRSAESISLDRVQDSAVHRSLLARALRYGDVEIESAGRDGAERLSRIGDAVGFSNDLLVAVEARRTGRPSPGDASGRPGPPAGGYAPPAAWETGTVGEWSPPPGYTTGHGPRSDGL